jgi:outer membrane protein OmpA-like peptidoglycan-associated protein
MHFRIPALGAGVVAIAIVAAGSPNFAEAQELLSAPLELQVFRPAMDSKGFLTLNASQILAPLDFSFGLVTTWARRPMDFETPVAGETSTFRIENLITPSFQAAVGLFQQRQIGLELGIVVPLGVMNGRAFPDDPRTPTITNDDINYAFDGQGLGDIVLHPKIRLANASRNKWGVSIIPSVVLPTGDKKKFLGEGQLIFQPSAAVDVELGRPGLFRIGINGGIRLRTKNDSVFVDEPSSFVHTVGGMPRNTGFGVRVKNEVMGGVALSWGVVPQRFDLVGEFYSFIGLDSQKIEGTSTSKLGPGGEALAGLKLYLARNSFFEAGVGYGVLPTSYGTTKGRLFVGFIFEPSIGDRDGDGYKDDVDLCPDDPEDFDDFEDQDGCPEPDNDKDGLLDFEDKCPNDPETKNGFQDEDGCPDSLTADRDGDGIPDDVDKCPDDPEDKDGFEDQDGCPDPDNDKDRILDVDDMCPNDPEDYDGFEDKDGCPDPDNDKDRILDVNDKCPNEPETYNGFQDDDGCPDQGKVIVRKGKLEILDKIYFETDKTDIKPISFPLLDAIAATIKGNPQLQLLEIQGHADERGSDQHNLELTDGRAHAVMNALVERGVNPGTLRAKGYGETKPICTQHNENCWSQNRRVEFIILKRAEEPLLRGGEGQ